LFLVILIIFISTFFYLGLEVHDIIEKDKFRLQKAMAEEALNYLGAHYLYSAEGQIGNDLQYIWEGEECRILNPKDCEGVRHFDCSGFVHFCANRVGLFIPMVGSKAQYHPRAHSLYYKNYSWAISLDQLRKGSLVFKERNGTIFHVGIYLGDGSVIECTQISPFKGVVIKPWTSWLNGNFSIRAANLIPRKV
jgi:cell wall-associated NlpC family hydrolase